MGEAALNLDERFTYGDYRKWPEGERWELIEGEEYCMSPAPMRRHQELLSRRAPEFLNFLRDKPCRGCLALFDVLFPGADEEDDEVATVLQPDLVVFCDPSKLTERGARGAPDLALEIL